MDTLSLIPGQGTGCARTALLIFTEHLPSTANGAPLAPARDLLVLPFERREKARQRVRLESGRDVGIQLARGTVLRGGDRLRAADGTVIEIGAAPEAVSTVRSRDLRELARLAYHLGNRHVGLEIGNGWVRYLADHVLDAMVQQLGFSVIHESAPFEPEGGAYGHNGERTHGHSHGAGHSHSHAHAHPHAHAHSPAQSGESDHAPTLDHEHDEHGHHDHRIENRQRHVFGRVTHREPIESRKPPAAPRP